MGNLAADLGLAGEHAKPFAVGLAVWPQQLQGIRCRSLIVRFGRLGTVDPRPGAFGRHADKFPIADPRRQPLRRLAFIDCTRKIENARLRWRHSHYVS